MGIKGAARALMATLLSAVLWVLLFFVGGISAITAGVGLMFGQGPAFITAGIGMLAACALLKKAVTNG